MRVVAAVIERDGEVLLCRRPREKRHGGRWEFPGGKILQNESILSAARREIREELSLQVLGVRGQSVPMDDPASDYTIEFVATVTQGDPEPLEHEEIAWVPLDEVTDYDLAPADRTFAEQHLRSVLGA